MDVLRPPMIRIGNRCYRRNPIEGRSVEEYEQEEMMEEFQGDVDVYADEVCDAFTNVEQTDSGFRLVLDIPSAYFKYIIGKKGETKKRLETETKTLIKIPRQGMEGEIVITGREKKGVISAKTRMDILVASARQKQPFTHFLSFPITAVNIQDQFSEFKEDVVRFCGDDRGVDSTIFQNPKKLHLTLGTLALMSEAEVKQATQILKETQYDLIEPLLGGRPLGVQVQGLEYMNDDPGQVDVLYAHVHTHDGSDRLQLLADRLVDKFTATGMMQREYDHVKLHITVMNTLMRKDPSGTSLPSRQDGRTPRESFDATNVLGLYKEYDFGPLEIDTLHLSQRYSTGSDGYYACAASVQLS